MFWKKKNKDEGEGEGKLFETPDADRGAFRVYPSKDKPVNIKVGGNQLTACDISAGGISFENKNFTKDETYSLELTLPIINETYVLETKVHKIDDKDICRCSILGLSEDQEDKIHSYILARQKEEISENKGKSF